MSRIRGLELLFNLEKRNFKSREDCVVAALHCLCVNENLQCVGIGDRWQDSNFHASELLPKHWNDNQDVYSLRYINKDTTTRLLLKATKMGHILQVDVARNESTVASMSVPVENHVSGDYSNEYSTAYKSLESLVESFRKNIMLNLKSKPRKESSSQKNIPFQSTSNPSVPPIPRANLQKEKEPSPSRYPRVGGSDLDPTGAGRGGMLMDPSSIGIPTRPTLPQFGVGTPGGLPRGAVPPGARFDPIVPPTYPSLPDPDHLKPPDHPDSK